MSSLVVEVKRVDEVKPHPNADKLELAVVGGWQCVVQKGIWEKGDLCVYFPPDTVLPEHWTENFGVTQYTSKGRIKSTRLRGEPSHGLVVKPLPEMALGENVAEAFGATKYKPPVRRRQGAPKARAQQDHPKFSKYTDIENLRHFPDIFEGMEVVATEKIHGANVRLGIINGQLVAGSRRMQRDQPTGEPNDTYDDSTYWWPMEYVPGIKRFLESFIEPQSWWQKLLRRPKKSKTVIVYGEIFGPSIQSFDYGQDGLAFRAFDIMIDGEYLDWASFGWRCLQYDIPQAPILYVGPYDLEKIKCAATGKSTLGGTHCREGVVVRPLEERTNPKVGRLIAKYVSDEYLLKDKTDYTEE